MHKCPKCGQEFEGNFCHNCGEQWQEQKTCPQCGASLNGSVRFCNNCGYAFVKTEEKPKSTISFKDKLKSAKAWIKSHLKIVVPIALAVVLVIILSCSIPACIANKTNGTYYKLNYNGELDESTYFILKSGKWEDEDGETGTYKKDGDNIRFYVEFFGETEELCDGTLINYVLKINGDTYVSSKHKHKFSEWEIIKEATCITDGMQTHACECGVKETEVISASNDYHKLDNYEIVDEQYHKGICIYCAKEIKQLHNGDNCDCGYPYKFSLNAGGNSYTLIRFYNTSAKQVDIPTVYNNLPVIAIGSSAFSGCSGLTSLTIPDGVETIGNSAFFGCSGLTSVTIPDSVIAIGAAAFGECSGLTSITVASKNTRYHNAGNCLIETNSKSLILGCKKSVIPTDGSVTTIGDHAFYGCSGLTSVTIPDSVTSIGAAAFYECSGLTSVTIPDRVTSIGDHAFYYCSGLTSVTIPDSVTSIGSYAFRHCSGLTSVTIPDSVTSIGERAFGECSGLTEINFGGTKAQWNAISKGINWDYNTGNYTVHCTDGDISKADS